MAAAQDVEGKDAPTKPAPAPRRDGRGNEPGWRRRVPLARSLVAFCKAEQEVTHVDAERFLYNSSVLPRNGLAVAIEVLW